MDRQPRQRDRLFAGDAVQPFHRSMVQSRGIFDPTAVHSTEPRPAIPSGTGAIRWDTGLFKSFTIRERIRSTFRAEAFNTTNHTSFSNPATNLSIPSTVGRITGTSVAARTIQFGLRVDSNMMHSQISRRVFLAILPVPAALLAAKPTTIKVGCQANAWPLKAGDFPQLLAALGEMKQLGYVGFECNIRFVQDQFGARPKPAERSKRPEYNSSARTPRCSSPSRNRSGKPSPAWWR